MRKFGLDLRRTRPGWRRFFPRYRSFDICDFALLFYGFDVCETVRFRRPPDDDLPPIPENGFMPPDDEPVFDPIADLFGGPGCPGVLNLQGFGPLEPIDLVFLTGLGVPTPTPGGTPIAYAVDIGGGPTIGVLRIRSDGAILNKSCSFVGDLDEAQGAAEFMNENQIF